MQGKQATKNELLTVTLHFTQHQWAAVTEAFGQSSDSLERRIYGAALDELREGTVVQATAMLPNWTALKEAAEFLEEYEGEAGIHTGHSALATAREEGWF